MSNREAKAAFDQATDLANRLRYAHAVEQAALQGLAWAQDMNTAPGGFEAELKQAREDWAELFSQYRAAMNRYTVAVEQSRNTCGDARLNATAAESLTHSK